MTPNVGGKENGKRIVQYYGRTTHYGSNTQHLPLLPMVNKDNGPYVTNILMATFSITPEATITLNGVSFSEPKFDWVRNQMKEVQQHGVKISMMVLGWFHLLEADWDKFYPPLRDALKNNSFDGIDIDVEDINNKQPFSLQGVIKLIDSLRTDMGPDFLITLAPVASAMWGGPSMTSFDYKELEEKRGKEIAWYNTQFYNFWGDLSTPDDYEKIIQYGWPPSKVVAGMACSEIWKGFVPLDTVARTMATLVKRFPDFAGIDGWDYTDAQPGGQEEPWEWAEWAAKTLGVANA